MMGPSEQTAVQTGMLGTKLNEFSIDIRLVVVHARRIIILICNMCTCLRQQIAWGFLSDIGLVAVAVGVVQCCVQAFVATVGNSPVWCTKTAVSAEFFLFETKFDVWRIAVSSDCSSPWSQRLWHIHPSRNITSVTIIREPLYSH